jgi:elongation factor P
MALSITDLKKGTLIQLENTPYKVVEYGQKVVGRGGSIVNVRIKSLIDGKVLDKTFKGNEQIDSANVNRVAAQYLYNDKQGYYFMDEATYNQFSIPEEELEEQKEYLKEGDNVLILMYNDQPIALDLPKNLPFKITYTEDVVKGDTTSNVLKEATIETGLVIRVPAFIKKDDIVRIDTRTGEYLSREK